MSFAHSPPATNADVAGRRARQHDHRQSRPRGLQADHRSASPAREGNHTGNSPPPGNFATDEQDIRMSRRQGALHETPDSIDSELSEENPGTSTPPESPEHLDNWTTSPAAEIARLSLENDRSNPQPQYGNAKNSSVNLPSLGSKRKRTPAAEQDVSAATRAKKPQCGHDLNRHSNSAQLANRRPHTQFQAKQPSTLKNTIADDDFIKQPLDKNARTDSGYASQFARQKSSSHTKRRLPTTSSSRRAPPQKTVSENADVLKTTDTPRQGSEATKSHYPGMIREPISSSISQEQLAAEVRGIYQSLSAVEDKCIKVDTGPASNPKNPLLPDDIQTLVALHRTLLYEHHDFLMATQHPSASPGLRGLAAKYNMPARMWKYGIHAFLEVLRHRRPDSQDSMMAFIYLAYQMIALLFETVSAFTDTWVECLGDLARYRMAIEEDREIHSIWGVVAAGWYSLAADRHPDIGRLNHHLGILERPSLRKLFLYCKSLTCVIRFPNALDSLSTLFAPIVQDESTRSGVPSAEARIVTYHAFLFTRAEASAVERMAADAIERFRFATSSKMRDIGVYLVLANISALFQWGDQSNLLWQMFTAANKGTSVQSQRPSVAATKAIDSAETTNTGVVRVSKTPGETNTAQVTSDVVVHTSADSSVLSFTFQCFNTIIRTGSDGKTFSDTLPSVHVMLVWFHSLLSLRRHVNDDSTAEWYDPLTNPEMFDWAALCEYLNVLVDHKAMTQKLHRLARRGSFKPDGQSQVPPLAEDYQIRGLVWSRPYFPHDWFDNRVDEDERLIENKATHNNRVERVQWLGLYLALHTDFIEFSSETNRFVVPQHQKRPASAEPIAASTRPQLDTKEHEPPVQLSSIMRPAAEPADEGFIVVSAPKKEKTKPSKTQKESKPRDPLGISGKPSPKRSFNAAWSPKKQSENVDVFVAGQDNFMGVDEWSGQQHEVG